MKKLAFFTLALTLLVFIGCKSQKYPDLKDGVYAEVKTNKGTFVLKLYEKATPLTVANFVELAEGTNPMVDSTYKGKKFYNGLTFHRVIKDFMIQGGDPKGDGSGNPGYKFPDEIVDSLKFDRKGLLAMANAGPATNGSQFFVTLKETPWLNGKHTIFGEVVKGQEIVDSIGSVKTANPGNKPVSPVIMDEVNIINVGKVAVPSFKDELAKAEEIQKQKEAKKLKMLEDVAQSFEAIKGEAEKLASGLKMKFTKTGTANKPAIGSKVLVNYAGYLTNGALFDSNIPEVAKKYDVFDHRRQSAGQYAPIPMDYSKDAQLIPGFKEALLRMKVGDKAVVFIPSHLAYGEKGAGGVIPPNADLIFELEIVGEQK